MLLQIYYLTVKTQRQKEENQIKCEAEVVATDCEDSEESQENQINDPCSTWDWQHRHQTITR